MEHKEDLNGQRFVEVNNDHEKQGPENFKKIPPQKNEREKMLIITNQYAAKRNLTPLLSLTELQNHGERICKEIGSVEFKDFITVLLSNYAWEKLLGGIPYHKRILLLPYCLRNKSKCLAEINDFGLLCKKCGHCQTDYISQMAEKLGYLVLIANSTTVVKKFLEEGKAEAVIGVGCLSSLERSFQKIYEKAIPSIAIPLYKDGCDNCKVDIDWVQKALHLKSAEEWKGPFYLKELHEQVKSWFVPDYLSKIFEWQDTQTESIMVNWFGQEGKRWRPFLTASIYDILKSTAKAVPETVKKLAIAVECFHKASLIHDDIEDDDDTRYGVPTLHVKYGIPVAINIGDFLIGEGYRLISESHLPPGRKLQILNAAALGHRDLCLGQGEELYATLNSLMLSSAQVLEIFKLKTAPAFNVALQLGAIAGGANKKVLDMLKQFSEFLGIAYQIQDDLEDFQLQYETDNFLYHQKPSLLYALAYEFANDREKIEFSHALSRDRNEENEGIMRRIIFEKDKEITTTAREMLNEYKNNAIKALAFLENMQLKILLHRLLNIILSKK